MLFRVFMPFKVSLTKNKTHNTIPILKDFCRGSFFIILFLNQSLLFFTMLLCLATKNILIITVTRITVIAIPKIL